VRTTALGCPVEQSSTGFGRRLVTHQTAHPNSSDTGYNRGRAPVSLVTSIDVSFQMPCNTKGLVVPNGALFIAPEEPVLSEPKGISVLKALERQPKEPAPNRANAMVAH
jgi:hypothetical protein